MLHHIESFFQRLLSDAGVQRLDKHEIEIATAALLAHCARADGVQSPEETARLETVLSQRFHLTPDEVASVLERAEAREREAIDIHRFTRTLHKSLDREARIGIVRLLWEIADADGRIDHDEHRMVSLTARLLDVEVQDAVAARLAARQQSSG